MRLSGIFAFAAATWVLAVAAPGFAQTPPPTPPTSPTIAAPAPQTAPKPAAVMPLPAGAKIAFVNLQVVFAQSDLGKQGQDRWRVLNEKLFANLDARTKEIDGLSQKIKTQQNLMDESVVRGWGVDLARLQREAQFAQQEAQLQIEQLQQEVLNDFGKKIQPVIDALRVEKGLQAIIGVQNEPGGMTLLSSEPGVDLSPEVIKRLNGMK